MNVKEWLGEDNTLGIDIWNNKYCYDNETFEEWLDRISGGNAEVRQIIKDKKFLFGGRILANRGLDKQGKKISLSNCYVIAPPEDNIESIFNRAKKLARTYSYGGGCGIDISKLRPNQSKVNNAAEHSSGAVSFMDLYSEITDVISQNGRRGALMLSISCEHPDVEEFIKIKSDLDKVTKANISVRITDKFMAAVENKNKFKLHFVVDATGEEIIKEIDAYEFFCKLCDMNWDYAEPGILFWDRIENWNLLSNTKEFKYAGTNPCFSGDMSLLTDRGYRTFEELCGTEPYIVNVNGNITKSKVWCSGEKDTVKVKTAKGEIICTPNHRFMTIDGNECFAKDLKGKYLMPLTLCNKKMLDRYIKYGFIQGDGQLTRLDSKYHEGIEVNIGKKDTDIFDLFSDEKYTLKSDRAIYVDGFKDDLIRLGFSDKTLPYREFPSTYSSWNKLEKASFLQGCYSANGSVIRNGRVSYKTTCKKFAEKLSKTLYEDFDIDGIYITTNKPKTIKFPNGEYECKESYDINIGKYKEITKFISEINFYQQYKREQLSQMIKSRSSYVYNVESNEKIKVYDFTEPERHWGIVEGYVVHNCAEEPLPAGGSCLLGSINLSEFTTNINTFDFDTFRQTVDTSVRALNEVLDEGLHLHPLEEQRKSVHDWRQIGLGIFGLADLLIKLKIIYGSKESLELCDAIGFHMADQAIQTSAKLAIENKTAYPKCNIKEVSSTAFFIKNTSNFTKEIVNPSGLYNSQLLTIAPTGSLSTMLGVSGGIEPIFANYYERKTESLHGHDQYYKVYTPIVKVYMDKHNLKDDSKLPEYFITAQSLNYVDRIEMQSVWQKHIDASISSTVNVPNNFTKEQVRLLYTIAWYKGLKGVTIYRDGCKRSGILSTDKKDSENKKDFKLDRGIIIAADDNCIGLKRTLHTGCGTLHCETFFDATNGQPLETYLSKGSTGGCNNFMIGLSRMISLSLRGGIDIYSIVDQLNSCGVCPSYAVKHATKKNTSKGSSCPVAIGNALLDMYHQMQDELNEEDYEDEFNLKRKNEIGIKQEHSKSECPECGSQLIFEGGCNICKSCGWTKCD